MFIGCPACERHRLGALHSIFSSRHKNPLKHDYLNFKDELLRLTGVGWHGHQKELALGWSRRDTGFFLSTLCCPEGLRHTVRVSTAKLARL